jgi:hypothetical protein
MTEAQAIKIAIECILEKQRKILPQASMYERAPIAFAINHFFYLVINYEKS